jgi:O-antigen/teichoic acid export membrane protein
VTMPLQSLQRPRAHSLLRNITANTACYLVTIGLAFLMFPILFHRLGAARYGVWMLISDVTGYYSYVGLGLRAGVTYFAGLYIAQEKPIEASEIVSTSTWSLTAAGILLACLGFPLARLFPKIFSTTGLDLQEITHAIEVLAVAIAISLPMEVLNSALTAAKRLDAVNGIEISRVIASSVATLIAVLFGYGLVTLALIQLSARVLIVPVIYLTVRKLLPELSFSLRHWKANRLKQLGRFGGPSLLIGLGWLAASRTDLVVVGATLGVSMVTYYAIPRSLMDYADSGIRAVAWSFTSHFTHLHAREESHQTLQLYVRGARLTALIVCILSGLIGVFGKSFLVVWQGRAFASSGLWWNQSATVLSILTIAFLPRLMNNMASQLSYSTNRLDFFMWIGLIGGSLKILLSLWFVKPYGLAGVAFSNLIPMFLFEGASVLAYLFREFAIPRSLYVREAIVKPLIPGAAVLAVGALLVHMRPPDSWMLLLAEALTAGAVGLVTAVAIGTTPAERQSFQRFMTFSDEPVES